MKKHLVIASIIATALSIVLAVLLLNYDILPHFGSTEMESIDRLMRIQASIAVVFFAIIITFIGYILIVFRRRRGEKGDGLPIKGYTPLEIAWTTIPLIIVMSLSVYAAAVLHDIGKPGPPETELEVDVLAFRFGWQFRYPEYNTQSFQLGLPVDRRVVFRMQSRDVVHSFWVPEFGPKMDVVPGMTTELRYTPLVEGQYTLYCAELCGFGHTIMTAPVSAMSPDNFQEWVGQQRKIAPPSTPSPPVSPGPPPIPGTSPASPITSPAVPNAVTIDLVARNVAFNLSTITVPAGAEVSVQFNNEDSGIPHNLAVYTDASARTPIFVGEIIIGPASIEYRFKAPKTPGNYFFRCDPHAAIMNGTFVVQ